MKAFELRRFELEGRNLWRELANPCVLTETKMRGGSIEEEAVPRSLLAAETTVRQLERDSRDSSGASGAWSAPALS
ncbi:MAG: hypothetical protein ACUVV6_03770 [Thermoplasmatota archaeon]